MPPWVCGKPSRPCESTASMKTNSSEPSSPWLAQVMIATPLGPMTLAANRRGLAGAWFEDQRHHPGPLSAPCEPDHPVLLQATQALDTYWQTGQIPQSSLTMDPQGTPFQQKVWRALLAIPQGSTSTYGDMARSLGQPNAARAVGAAIGRNPISVLIPCHRVLGTDGSMTGYAGGLARKQALLALEQGTKQNGLISFEINP
jgi:methylated-DNA-[protein]-cysteine S-methyltransferase